MKPVFTLALLVVLALAAVVGWTLEAGQVSSTVNGDELITKAGLVGVAVGFLLGFVMVKRGARFLDKFQGFGGSIFVFALLFAYIGHLSNRQLLRSRQQIVELPVIQVSPAWSARNTDAHTEEGYFIFVDTPDGIIRLLDRSAEPPSVGRGDRLAVAYQSGYWGYPRYVLPRDAGGTPVGSLNLFRK